MTNLPVDFNEKLNQEVKEIHDKVDADMAAEAAQLKTDLENAAPVRIPGITPNLNLNMTWVEDQKMFSMQYRDGDKAIFQVLMTPASFELLTMDMVKTIKNFNLYQAQKYQAMLKAQQEAAKSEKDPQLENYVKDSKESSNPCCGGSLPCDPNADQGNQTQSQQPPSAA